MVLEIKTSKKLHYLSVFLLFKVRIWIIHQLCFTSISALAAGADVNVKVVPDIP